MAVDADVEARLRAKFEAVLPHLDERAARLVLAGEARSLGHGGIAAVARASGSSRSRVGQGVAEFGVRYHPPGSGPPTRRWAQADGGDRSRAGVGAAGAGRADPAR